MRAWTLCLAAALAAGVGLRLFDLGHSLRVDEIEAWALAQDSLASILSNQDRSPHSAALGLFTSRVLGDSEFSLRLPHAMYGIASLVLMFLLGRRLFDERAGALGCLLLAVSPFHVQYSQEARYYAPLIFYALSSLYCIASILLADSTESRGKLRAYWIGLALSQTLALSLHRFALYPAFLSLVFLLAASARRPRGWASPIGPTVAAALAGAAMLAWQWPGLSRFLQGELSPARFLPLRGTLTLRESYLQWHYRSPDASIVWELVSAYSGGQMLGGIFLAAALAGCVAAGRARLERSLALWLWLVLPAASLFIVRSRTHFELRYFCFLLPVWLLLAAGGMVDAASVAALRFGAAAPWVRRAALASLTAVVLCLSAAELGAYYRLPKARLREAFAHIGARGVAGDAVSFYPAWNALWYGYYRLPPGLRFYHPSVLNEKSPAFPSLVGSHERLWLAATWIEDPIRRREFMRFKSAVERYYSVEAKTVFRSRDPNDDHRVWLLRRKPNHPPFHRAEARPEDAPPRKDPFVGGAIRLALNLQEAARRMAATRRYYFRALDTLALLRGPAAEEALDEASRFCGGGCVVLAWSGTGRIGVSGAESSFKPGDVLSLPPGRTLASLTRSVGEVLLVLQAPAGAGSVRVLSRRLRSGDEEEERLPGGAPRTLVTGVMLEGQVRVENDLKTKKLYFRKGDVYRYVHTARGYRLTSNRAGSDSLELRVIEDRPPNLPDLSISSSAGKTAGLEPPMLLP